MWIRSQDKKQLINADNVVITEIKGKYYIFKECECDNCVLGIYSSEEKALKVLDEIQERIEYPEASLISPTKLQNYYRLSSVGHFYQMPQDDEVEV